MKATYRKTPMFKSLSDDALRTEYAAWRELAYNNAAMAQLGNRNQLAVQMGRIMRNVDIIEAIIRQRKINPV